MASKMKYFYMIFSVFAFFVCGFFLSSCCSPKPVKVSVNFIDADERLGLDDYSYYVEFGDATKITFNVPAGYDHTKIKSSINGNNIDYVVSYDNGQVVEEGYEYAVSKNITMSMNSVKRNFVLDIDLSEMTKIKHQVTLDSDLSNFRIVVVPKEKTESKFTSLKSSDVLERIEFNGQVAEVEYGSYILFVHTTRDDTSYNSIYSNLNHYTSEKNQANIGTLEYSVYNLAKKGNTNYGLNNDPYTDLYYFGEVKEDIKIYSSIPEFEEDKGFDIERQPNIFYLFTNLSEYNSDLLTMEAFTSTTSAYDATDDNIDRIDGNVVKKISPYNIFNDRYDMYKIYLGENLDSDDLLEDSDKQDLNTDLYFVVSSSMGIENINFYFLKDAFEKVQYGEGFKLSLGETKTDKNRYYLQLDKETLNKFSLNRDLIDQQNIVHEYLSGSAILYPEVDYAFFDEAKKVSYSRIFQEINIQNNDANISKEDLFVNLYIKDGEENKYGLIDHEFWINMYEKKDCIYFRTSDLFDLVDNQYEYKNNLYIEVRGKKYTNFKSVLLNNITISYTFYGGADDVLTRDPLEVVNAKEYNGHKDFLLPKLKYEGLGEYTLKITVNLKSAYKEGVKLDFSQLNFAGYSDGIYITSNDQFESLSDFAFIHNNNKADFNTIQFSMYRDLYYFAKCTDPNFDIEVRLDPDDPDTVISSSKSFCDIMGNPLNIEVNGEPYYIKVIKQDTIFELITEGKMFVVNKS